MAEADEVDIDEDGGECPSNLFAEGSEFSLAVLEEMGSFLGENVSPECNFQGSSLAVGIRDPPALPSGRIAVSIKKSSRVARDFSCFPRDAIVFWHSASFPAAAAKSSCQTNFTLIIKRTWSAY